jgi:hypothetical protein
MMTRGEKKLAAAGDGWATLRHGSRRLLIAAALFHIAVTLSIYGLGRYELLPGMIDSSGTAVSFSPDGVKLRIAADKLSDALAHGEISDWFHAPAPPHLKLYSIPFVVLRPFFGSTILSAEPLNVFYYLAILILTFTLGRETLGRRTGLIAATVVAFWPSLLLHTTQLLKDPLFLVGMLGFVHVSVRLLAERLSWPVTILTATGGGGLALVIWLGRDSMGELPIATATLGLVLLIVRQFHEKFFLAPNVVGMALLLMISAGVVAVVPTFHSPKLQRGAAERFGSGNDLPDNTTTEPIEPQRPRLNLSTRFVARVQKLRQRFFVEYPNASSNIDSSVQLTSLADLVRYLPRALMIGLLAPFPNMWFASGNQVGSAGRLVSGMETMALYVIEGLAIPGLFSGLRGRRSYSVWLLLLVAALGITSLGLVVVNIGTLYRLRYVFFILLIIPGMEGARKVAAWFRGTRKNVGGLAADV